MKHFAICNNMYLYFLRFSMHIFLRQKIPVKCIQLQNVSIRHFGRSAVFSSKYMKVAILGAASKTGSCLSLFLKQSSLIDELAIYDSKSTYGVARELNYIDTKCKVSTCDSSESCLKQTLENAKIVMIVNNRTFDESNTSSEILRINGDTLSDLIPNVIRFCPRALVAITMNPINSLIPLATEIYKKAGILDYNRLFGVTTLDCVRANTFAAEVTRIPPECVMVPVIGGSCPETRVPVFSQAKPRQTISQEDAIRMTQAVRLSEVELTKVNRGKESSPFATAFAAARFCVSLCKALRHQSQVVECAYVRSCVMPQVTYFAAPLELGPDGIQRHLGIPPLNSYECKLVKAAIPVLKRAITEGEAVALGRKSTSTELCPVYANSCNQVLVIPGSPQSSL